MSKPKTKICDSCGKRAPTQGAKRPWSALISRHKAPCGLDCTGGQWALVIEDWEKKGVAYHGHGCPCAAAEKKDSASSQTET